MISSWTWVQWLHILGAVMWIGGIIFVVMILRPVMQRQLEPQERKKLLKQVSGRMQAIMNFVIALQVLTGGVLAWRYLSSSPALMGTYWGHTLVTKLVLVALMIALYVATPRLLVGRGPKLGTVFHYVIIGAGVVVIFLGNVLRGG